MNLRFWIMCICILSIIACQKSIYESNKIVYSNIYIPSGAIDTKYYAIQGTYQVIYKANVIFPSEQFIDDIVDRMAGLGWRRLEYDFWDGRGKLNNIRKGNIYEKWGGYIDPEKGVRVDTWVEDFEDNNKNVVRYHLLYEVPVDKKYLEKDDRSWIKVISIYMPSNMRPDPVKVREHLDAETIRMQIEEKKKHDRWMRITGP